MIYAVKAAPDITLNEPLCAMKINLDLFQGRVATPTRTESMGLVVKHRLIYGFQYHSDRFLYQLVAEGWNS